MPITKSAKKALRVSLRRRAHNERRKKGMRSIIKKVRKLSDLGKKDEVKKLLPSAYKAIDKALKRGIIKSNTAARKKSQVAKIS